MGKLIDRLGDDSHASHALPARTLRGLLVTQILLLIPPLWQTTAQYRTKNLPLHSARSRKVKTATGYELFCP